MSMHLRRTLRKCVAKNRQCDCYAGGAYTRRTQEHSRQPTQAVCEKASGREFVCAGKLYGATLSCRIMRGFV